MKLELRSPTEPEFQHICNYIHDFQLDDRELYKEQFTGAYKDNKLVGFGRLKKHEDCTELCSLGVITPLRGQGIGKAIVKELIKQTSDKLFLACIIPEFFQPFGFETVSEIPPSIINKLNYCSQELVVPEKYVAMMLKKQSV